MNASKLEAEMGIEVYASGSTGIGGRIRHLPEDFQVEEVLIDGSRASLQAEVPKTFDWGRYLLCVLIKRNWDTLIATRKIAENLGISPDRIQIAGIKDAKALTAQHITISRVTPEMISVVKMKDLTVKPLRFVDEELSPRLLFGNIFRITIRAIESDEADVERRIEETRGELEALGGLPNFFGHQRFGTTRPITHLIGYHIVRRDFENAVRTFLSKTSMFEHPDSREARQHLSETQDFKDAFSSFPKHLIYERLMLEYLAKYPRDFLGAFHKLPLRLRKLFVQAYQSLLFNKFLSERIKRGIPLNQPEIGDYVIELDRVGLPTERCCKATVDNLSTIKGKMMAKKAGVAAPLVGFKQPPSEGVQGEIEEAILERENIRPIDFRIPKMPEISSPGGLRLMLTPMIDFHSKEACKDPLNPNKVMVELGFTLLKGSYATILLREFMKLKSDLEVVSSGF